VASDTLRVLAAPTQENRAPTATIAGPSTAAAGATVSFTTGAADADGDSPLACAVDFGDGSAVATLASCGAGATHAFAAGTYTVTITARDPKGATGTATASISVSAPDNPAPVATLALAPKTLAVGAATTATIGATDANHATAALACTVQWGDGESAAAAGCAGPLAHAYGAPGLYTVTVTARDPQGATGVAQDTVRVLAAETANRAPEVYDLVTADGRGQPYAGPLVVGTASCRSTDGSRQYTACVRFGFRDADGAVDAPWSAHVDWGDGTTWAPNALPAQSASVLAPHRYTAPGTYAVRVRVTDRRGLSGEQTITLLVRAP
jgi:PKD repeat protein